MRDQLLLMPEYLTAHLQLALISLLLGIAISVPLGVLVARVRWLEQPVLGITSVFQTIPGLALLAIMVPLLAAAHLPSIGFLPAFIALVLYSMLPLVRNTVTALGAVDPALIEAARAVGMTSWQRLLRVEIPLAMPVIIAGIRTATVWTVAIATLSTPVGATSLGNYIFSGLQTRNFSAILVGCFAIAVLALGLDGLVRLVAIGWERRRRGIFGAAVSVLALLCLYTGISLAYELMPDRRGPIVVGAKTFTEQYILSEILAGEVAHEAGNPTEVKQSLGSTVAFDALRSGEIDFYVEYSGTLWATVMHREGAPPGGANVLAQVGKFLHDHYGIAVVATLGFENAYRLAMPRRLAERLSIRRISDLAPHAPTLSIGGDYEFFARSEWQSMRRTYGLGFSIERIMDPSLLYGAAKRGDVDVVSVFSTDGRIEVLDLVVLKDDRGVIPPYDAVILASAHVQHRHPQAVSALRRLSGKIDGNAMRRMNLAVDQSHTPPATVAKAFLERLWQK